MGSKMESNLKEYISYSQVADWEHERLRNGNGRFLKFIIIVFLVMILIIGVKEIILQLTSKAPDGDDDVKLIIISGNDPLQETREFPIHLPKEPSPKSDELDVCKMGATKMEKCNSCTCVDGKLWACTRMFCGSYH